ncbi:MAG TPA: VWA domain-containing protein [Acidobacteriaceae bacterium]|nr:VWA domain-containing protein [Acidobacteriaceae bacterium]
MISAGAMAMVAAGIAAQQSSSNSPYTFQRTVRRVIVDVVVTDRSHNPVHGLKRGEFKLYEDGHEQDVRSWEAFDTERDQAFVPPRVPPLPPDTFMDVPASPERGPLYVVVYDMDHIGWGTNVDDQMTARKQLEKFLRAMPQGARVELYVLAQKLQLLQGFTTDRDELLQVFDVKRKEHIPWVLLTRENYAGNDVTTPFQAMAFIAKSLNGLPGRKNLIWLSSQFPVPLSGPGNSPTRGNSGPNGGAGGAGSIPNMPSQEITGSSSVAGTDVVYQQLQMREAWDALNTAQVSVYPVDVQGLNADAGWGGIDTVAQQTADATGGEAYYNTNDISGAMAKAMTDGGVYYELSYQPHVHAYDGKLHQIKVVLDKPGYTLEYRQFYYDDDPNKPLTPEEKRMMEATADHPVAHHQGDSMWAYMVRGAPAAHDILFRAQIHAAAPAMATHEQMADLQMQPAYFVLRKRNHQAKAPAPIPLRRYTIDYLVLDQQAQVRSGQVLEFAACAYDADGKMLNGISQNAVRMQATGKKGEPPLFRAEQTLEVPTTAQWLRVAVRDVATDRIGTIEVRLPLPDDKTPAPATTAEMAAPNE